METETNPIIGYVPCYTCKTPKAIKQGRGKRSAFVHGRCECGPDTRTGAAAQAEMKAVKSLEEVQAILNPKPEPAPVVALPIAEPEAQRETQTESEPKEVGALACVGMGAVIGVVCGGLFKAMRAVA